MKERSKQRSSRKQNPSIFPLTFWILAILAALGVISYWNSFDVPMVFDDLVSIQKQAGVRFGDYFLHPGLTGGRGLLMLTFAANSLVHGVQVWGYHLVNVVLHVLNGFLIFFIAKHIFRRATSDNIHTVLCAFFAAAVFLLHPVQTESVTYISSRSEVLSTLFYAGAFLIFIKVPNEKVGFFLSLVVGSVFLAALMSKETAITLPGVLVLYDFIFRADARIHPLLSRWRFYITFILGGSYATYYVATRVLSGSIGAQEGHLTAWSYFLTQTRVIVQYVRILFLPVKLNLDHYVLPSYGIIEPSVIASLLFLCGIVVLGWYFRRKEPIVSFAIFWFFITLSPTSSFVAILDVMFEHRLYLPLVAVCLLFPLLIDRVCHWLRTNWKYDLRWNYCCIALVAMFLVGTILRNQVWRDEVRLWSDVIEKSPHKARGYNALSFAYYKRAQFDRALDAAKLGLQEVSEESVAFYETIGNMNLRLGRYDEAIAGFTESTKAPDKRRKSTEYNNVGVAYLFKWHELRNKQAELSEESFRTDKQQILESAAQAFLKSFQLEEDTFSALDSYINVMHDNDRDDQIIPELKTRFGENNYRFLYAVAKVADWHGDFNTASDYYEKAAKGRPGQKLIYFNHGLTLTSLKKTDAAIEKYMEALRVDPLFTEANYNIALLYAQKNDDIHALTHFAEALRMDPNNILSHMEMAKIYMRDSKPSLAREHLSAVLSISPNHQEAIQLWQQLGS